MRTRVVTVVVAAVAAFGASVSSGQTPAPFQSSRQITLEVHGVRLSEAVATLGRAGGVHVSLAHGVPDDPIDALFVNVPFESALQILVSGQCLDYVVTDARTVLVTRSTSGDKTVHPPGPHVVVSPDCSDGYRPPRVLDLRPDEWTLLAY